MELESALPIVLDTLTRSAKRLQLACTIVQNKKDCTGIALLTLLAGSTVLIGLLACSLIYSWKSDYLDVPPSAVLNHSALFLLSCLNMLAYRAPFTTFSSSYRRASSQDASVLKPAEAQLKEWESQPGFYSVLLAVVANHAIDLNVRWLATLCVKNGVDRYWRKTATNAINDDEKNVIRQRLLLTLNEPVTQVIGHM